MPEIAALFTYPVKSLQGIPLNQAAPTSTGLGYDRKWMVVDETGQFVTQREIPQMATVPVGLTETHLLLGQPRGDCVSVAFDNTGKRIEVAIWRDRCVAVDEGEEVSSWLTRQLGLYQRRQLRLVKMSDSEMRPVPVEKAKGFEVYNSFSDSFPFLVTVKETLDLLNIRLCKGGAPSIPMSRFRPNIVISGTPPLSEHSIATLVNEKYHLQFVQPCKRCVITTIDQSTGRSEKFRGEPLRTLAQLGNPLDKRGAFFGQHAILASAIPTVIRIGDCLSAVMS